MEIINEFLNSIVDIFKSSGFATNDWRNYIMIGIACVLLYLAIKREFEPLLLLPIAFGMMMVNLYPPIMAEPTDAANGGLFYYLYLGVKLGIYPPLIFLGIGAMTDFGPLIANPKSFLLGAAAQLGIFVTFIGAIFIGNLGIPNLSFTALGLTDCVILYHCFCWLHLFCSIIGKPARMQMPHVSKLRKPIRWRYGV